MDNKTDLRLKAKSIRKNINITQLSKFLCEKIRQLEVYKNAKNVLIFYPKEHEINLLELLKDNKNFYLPKVCEDELLVCPYTDKLKISTFNICEPCSNPVEADVVEVAIVPALMADENGYRLGYGKGFYDRFLSANPHIKTVLPIAKELFVKELPHDKFDVRIDFIITGKSILQSH